MHTRFSIGPVNDKVAIGAIIRRHAPGPPIQTNARFDSVMRNLKAGQIERDEAALTGEFVVQPQILQDAAMQPSVIRGNPG